MIRVLIISTLLVLPSLGHTADYCTRLRDEADTLVKKIAAAQVIEQNTVEEMIRVLADPNHDTDYYMAIIMTIHGINEGIRQLEDRSEWVRSRRIKECDLPVTYEPPKRSKKT